MSESKVKWVNIKDLKYDMTPEEHEEWKRSVANLFFFKCQANRCRLEFMILSWKEDWHKNHNPHCPECGEQEASFLRHVKTDKKVYEVVHGTEWSNK